MDAEAKKASCPITFEEKRIFNFYDCERKESGFDVGKMRLKDYLYKNILIKNLKFFVWTILIPTLSSNDYYCMHM